MLERQGSSADLVARHDVWLHSISFRSPTVLRFCFWSFRVHVSGVAKLSDAYRGNGERRARMLEISSSGY